MQVEFHGSGIYLPEIDLWLDKTEPCAATWISHGHSDHARGCHGQVIGTSTTLRIYRMRLGLSENDTEPELNPLEFGESMEWNGAQLTAFPASHILGAAQLLVEYRNERLVYTGDIKLRRPFCGEQTEPFPCDRLIIESTFGLPIYNLLDREDAAERIVRFASACLQEGSTPAFVGYPLGRGQEIVTCFAGREFRRPYTAQLPDLFRCMKKMGTVSWLGALRHQSHCRESAGCGALPRECAGGQWKEYSFRLCVRMGGTR